MKRLFPTKMLALLACLMCTTSALAQEAYAVFTPDNTTLTFYYDTQRSTRAGTTYDLNSGNYAASWSYSNITSLVTHVIFDPSFKYAHPTSTSSWFYNMNRLESIDGIEYLNTSEVTNMSSMFSDCNALTSLDVSNFNTENVIYMSQMFFASVSRISPSS